MPINLEITNQIKKVKTQALFFSMKDKAIPAVIGEKVCWYRVLDVQESEEVAIEPVIIPLATACRSRLVHSRRCCLYLQKNSIAASGFGCPSD